jgi:hypothetical protein
MKYLINISTVLMIAVLFSACKKEEAGGVGQKPVVVLPDQIRQNRILKSDTVYVMRSAVFVQNKAVLTIEPGTLIKTVPDRGSSRNCFIAIERNAKLMAEGTIDKPIVFTSGAPAGQRQHGDWLGIILFGNAPVSAFDPNLYEPVKEMSVRPANDVMGGGSDPADNSGILKYVRIEFAGNDNREALTLVGVGTGTIIENIEASYTEFAGFGFYGGTVNAKHLVAFNNMLSGFVYANGYSGKQQFLLSYRHPYFARPGSFVYTCDGMLVFNDLDDYPILQNTRPVLSNVTVIGPYNNPGYNEFLPWNAAVNITLSASIALNNAVLMGMPKGGIKLGNDGTAQHIQDGSMQFGYNLVHSNNPADAFTVDASVSVIDAATMAQYATDWHNEVIATPDLFRLNDPFNFQRPGVVPKQDSPALAGADFSGADFSTWFEKVPFRGAFGSTDWMAGWTSFYPVTTPY